MKTLYSSLIAITFALLSYIYSTNASTESIQTSPISTLSNLTQRSDFYLVYDPPNGFYSHSKTFLYTTTSFSDDLDFNNIRDVNNNNIFIYYEFNGKSPTLSSPYLTKDKPYIELSTPFLFGRLRNISLIGLYGDLTSIQSSYTTGKSLTISDISIISNKLFRTKEYNLHYFIEGAKRPSCSAFHVPSVISQGQFLHLHLEMNASVLAIAAIGSGIQQFADFFSFQGRGTYLSQITTLNLTAIDPQLTGFEGGFSINISTSKEHYGVLVPHSDGNELCGKVVRINLKEMVANASVCALSYRTEFYDHTHNTVNITYSIKGVVSSVSFHANTTASEMLTHYTALNILHTCVSVLDLMSLHPEAKGFRKGFASGRYYGYLSPGEYSVAARVDARSFTLMSTQLIDFSVAVDPTNGGYSGGFSDGSWACFNPYHSYSGPAGGIRSHRPVDRHHLVPYFNSILTCVNDSSWTATQDANALNKLSNCYELKRHNHWNEYFKNCLRTVMGFDGLPVIPVKGNGYPAVDFLYQDLPLNGIVTFDLSYIHFDMRGFSDCVRAGRYVYFSPLQTSTYQYASKVLRLYLGLVDIGTMIMNLRDKYIKTNILQSSTHLLNEVDTVVESEKLNIFLENLPYLSSFATILDLSKIEFHPYSNGTGTKLSDMTLGGFSSIFTFGTSVFLVPYRSEFQPKNGQRGFGLVTRIDMNLFRDNVNPSSYYSFDSPAVVVYDLPITPRSQQFPPFTDLDLRGFSGGYASGKYVYFIPFFSGSFSGKIARIEIPDSTTSSSAVSSTVSSSVSTQTVTVNANGSTTTTSTSNPYNMGKVVSSSILQVLDLTQDRQHEGLYKAYRGGFPSLWQAVYP